MENSKYKLRIYLTKTPGEKKWKLRFIINNFALFCIILLFVSQCAMSKNKTGTTAGRKIRIFQDEARRTRTCTFSNRCILTTANITRYIASSAAKDWVTHILVNFVSKTQDNISIFVILSIDVIIYMETIFFRERTFLTFFTM